MFDINLYNSQPNELRSSCSYAPNLVLTTTGLTCLWPQILPGEIKSDCTVPGGVTGCTYTRKVSQYPAVKSEAKPHSYQQHFKTKCFE